MLIIRCAKISWLQGRTYPLPLGILMFLKNSRSKVPVYVGKVSDEEIGR
jgi:hypothetical protein